VDDDPEILELLRDALRLAGYEPEVTTDSVAAMAGLAAGGYDLVLSDIMMPEVSGLRLLSAAKRASPGTEVILLTGHPTPERALEAARGGAFACLVKPFRIDELLARASRPWRSSTAGRRPPPDPARGARPPLRSEGLTPLKT